MTTVDWQTVSHGAGVQAVSYFLGTGLEPELRADVERDLVKASLATLRAGGVKDLSFEACWDQYRRYAFAGFVMAMISSMSVGPPARRADSFMAIANQSGRMAL